MLKVDRSLLGFRYTKWHGCPAAAVSNGRARMVVNTFGDMANDIYQYSWPMDGGEFNIAGGYSYGLQFQVNPATPPVAGSQVWKTQHKGYLEDSAVSFARFVKSVSENAFFPDGLEVEAYVYCPNNTILKDCAVILFHFKNSGTSQISFTFAVYSADYSSYTGVEKYAHPDYSALVKSNGKTLIWGSDTAPQDCYIDGVWRIANYLDSTPNSNWLRWNITLDAGAERLLAYIIVYGDTESTAITNYNIVKAWNHKELIQKELRFWKAWLGKGKTHNSGIWEVDQLARISLCLVKSFVSQDNHALPSTLGDGYPWSHWPADAWTCYYALTLWGHLDEAKNYFGTFVKNVTEYIEAHSLNLYKAIHICKLTAYEPASPPSNYTAEDCFLLPIMAVEAWKKNKTDIAFRDDIWSWIQTFMDEIDGDLIASGEWKDHFNHVNIYDSFESWLFVIPHELFGNSTMVVSLINALLVRCYEEAADLAEAEGEHGKASMWRSRAETIRDKFYDFWTGDRRASYYYWGDVTEYGCNQGWPSTDQTHSPLPEKPVYRLSWIAGVKDDVMRKAARLYYDNYLAYYSGLIAAEPCDNWMFGKVEKRLSYGAQTGFDMHLWDIFLAAAYMGLDDVAEDFLLRIKLRYGTTRNGLFDEWPTWDGDAGAGYHMTRDMGLFLTGFAFLFNRLDPAPVKRLLLQLRANGRWVTVLKNTGSTADSFGNISPSFEPVYVTEALIEPLQANEEIVKAGFASVDDCRLSFKAYTPIEVGDRIRINDADYVVQTVERHHYKDRIVKKEVYAKRVIE